MTEMSYVWGGIATGDAQTALGGAPYSDDDWADIWSFMLQPDRTLQGPINTSRAGFTGLLEVTNPSGTTIRVATGAAIVDGRLYTNSANVDEDVNGRGTGYYNVVLRKIEAAQTIRVVILGPDVGVPTVTQDATMWEISIASFHLDDTTDTISALFDFRVFVDPLIYSRQGGSALAWDTVGTTKYVPNVAKIEVGAIQWTGGAASNGAVLITFPTSFPYGPVVLVSVMGDATYQDITVSVDVQSGVNALISWEDQDGATHTTVDFTWIAIGEIH